MTYLDLLETVGTRPALVAHRGHWKQAPENSLAAIEAAIVAGADVVEIDIRMSADCVPMVFHDNDLERMTGQPSAVSDLPLAKLSELGPACSERKQFGVYRSGDPYTRRGFCRIRQIRAV